MDALRDLLKQTEEWPVSVLVVVTLNFVGASMKRSGYISNDLIPSVLMLLGAAIYVFVGDLDTVRNRNPHVILCLYGLFLGAISWVFHAIIWKSIERKFPDLRNGHTGDTDFIVKHRDHPPE